MDMPSLTEAPAPGRLLARDDPPVFAIANAHGRAPVLLTADHAGRAFPAALDRLGLQAGTLARHVAYDIGVERMTRRLAELLDARAVLHGYSRLLIDPNRPPDDPTSICRVSDGVVIPGNRGLTPAGRRDRIETLFTPYHQAIDAELSALMAPGPAPALVSLHSFTPSFRGYPRPWHVGVLWDGEDDRLARPLMRELARDPDLVVGDNQPYSGRGRHGYTVETHAQSRGLANALIEVRQDLIADDAGADAWAGRLAQALGPALAAARQASVAPEPEAAGGQ